MTGPQPAVARMLPDGRRLHLHHGPIDLIIEAFGPGAGQALSIAELRFATVLEELVCELDQLRKPCRKNHKFRGAIAQRMQKGTEYFLPEFITPMACVAGSVADEVLAAMTVVDDIDKIYVNNGGDTAIYLSPGTSMKAAIAAPGKAEITIRASDDARGIATSGWRGRSYSLGIADSVSVVASTCARADAAATMIANAVNLPDHNNVERAIARDLSPDTDLGNILVTTEVGELSKIEITSALDKGAKLAQSCINEKAIKGAILFLKNQNRQIGEVNLIHNHSGEPAIA